MGWNWATLIVVALILAAVVAFVWSWRAMHREASSRPPTALMFGVPVLAAGVAFGAWFTADEWDWLLADGTVRSDGADAPPVEVAEGAERFVLVDGSQVTYRIDERLGGSDSTAVGTTTVLAGEIAVDRETPSDSVLGTIVVNVERFESDSTLRDKRVRHDFLESTEFPHATFVPTSVDGLPDTSADGERIPVEITGDLTVKETTATETFSGWVRIDDDRLTAEMSTTVLMSTYDVGPIAISGLVSTSDEVELTFSLVAVPDGAVDELDDVDLAGEPVPTDTTRPEVTNALVDPASETATPAEPVEPAYDTARFSAAVLPTIETHCASCHVPGGPGAATVEFATIADVAAVAADIALVTESRYMPPWTAGDLSVDFEHDWSLTDEQIAEIAAWAEAGGAVDVEPSTPLEPRNAIVVPLDADVTVTAEPYTGSVDQRDDYRCQIYELPPADDTRWITGYTIVPDQVEIVHHAIFFRADAAVMDDARALDARDEAPGWPCFGLAGLRGTEQIGGWAPGQQPKTYAEGSGIRMEPGDFLVTQIHYHYDHDAPADESALEVEFADADQLAAGAYDDVVVTTYLAPAEIPCRDDESGPLCDRATVIADIRDKFGDFAAIIPDGLIAQCGADLQAMMADTDGVGYASCDHRASAYGEIVGVLGHMHEFGETFRMTLNPGTPDEQILLDIPNWAFEWQFDYRPVDSIVVGPGDVIRVECTWDRSLAPMPEPRHITWNEGTEDEMCYSTLSTVDR